MSKGDIEVDETAINNLRNDYKQHLSPRNAKSTNRAQQKGGASKSGAKAQHNNAKSRQNSSNRKK